MTYFSHFECETRSGTQDVRPLQPQLYLWRIHLRRKALRNSILPVYKRIGYSDGCNLPTAVYVELGPPVINHN